MSGPELVKFIGSKAFDKAVAFLREFGVSTLFVVAGMLFFGNMLSRFADLHFKTVDRLSDAAVKSTEIQERQSRISANIEKIVGDNRSVFVQSADKINEIHRDVKDVKELVSRKEKPE